MERKDFLKAAGLAGLGSMLPLNKLKAAELEKTALQRLEDELSKQGACILYPADMEGPYPLDLSNKQNGKFFRQEINEGKPGVPLNVTFTVQNLKDNCAPVQNVRVDMWQCDAMGLYSGYANQTGHGGAGQNLTGQTFCRGIQLTDRNGQVTFKTIYPGWYAGRAVHLHMNFFVNSQKTFTTQCAFPNALNNEVFTQNVAQYGGKPDTTNEQDLIFKDMNNTKYQIVTIDKNASGGYDATLTVVLNLPKGSDVVDLEPQTYRQLVVKQNYPNPFNTATTIPFILTNASDVVIDIYDLQGKKVHSLLNQRFEAGEQRVILNNKANGLNLAPGNYVYQVTIESIAGKYHQCKVLAVE